MFSSDPMSGSYFIAQTNTFLLIDATAVTLGQGHGKVIEYISPDPYILCAMMWNEIPTVEVWEWISSFISHFAG